MMKPEPRLIDGFEYYVASLSVQLGCRQQKAERATISKPERISAVLEAIVSTFGPWTAHNIALTEQIITRPDGPTQQWRVDFFDSIIRAAGRSPKSLLDLACLEGLFAIEFARRGLTTVGIDARDAHLVKAEFARSTLELTNCRFIRGDVRSLPIEIGNFDVVLAAGILYHLDFPDCVKFLRDIAVVSNDLLIIDSYFAYEDVHTSYVPLSDLKYFHFEGRAYRGREIVEYADPKSTGGNPWGSIDSTRSVWLTEEDVISALSDRGCRLIERQFQSPSSKRAYPDRPTLVFKRTIRDAPDAEEILTRRSLTAAEAFG
ncbi:class I SAM-dependent methyltransferase [Bradyrhizobium sp. HKCCYLS3077]|uniref:class I SAM-dependent methyltransferase n=1 Tax=Bradyrhizobium sp. HKCCYLS3077 TaxID=3420761 RepID=UPI003EBEE935